VIDPLLIKQANTLAKDLKDAAERSTVTYKRPKKAKEIIERYKVLWPEWKLSDTTIREIVNYLRVTGVPIGSNSNGYFYILDLESEGARHTRSQIESRLIQMIQAFGGIFPEDVDGLIFRLQAKAKNPNQEMLVL